MGSRERQRAKVIERMQAPLHALLDEDEEQRVALHAQSPLRLWIVAIPAIVISMILAAQGLELKSWVLPVSMGLWIALTMRFFFIVATDRRILVIRLGPMSMKRWTFEGEIDVANLASVVYEDKLLQDRITIVPTEGKPRRYMIVRGWEDDAERFARMVSPPKRLPG